MTAITREVLTEIFAENAKNTELIMSKLLGDHHQTLQSKVPKKWYEDVIKQIDKFDGENFSDWKYKFRNAIHTYANKLLWDTVDKAVKDNKVVEYDDFPAEGRDDFEQMSQHLHNVLVCKMSGESLIIVQSTDEMNGLEAWRKLNLRFDSKSIGKRVTLIRRLVSPPKVKLLKEVGRSIEVWEHSLRTLQSDYSEKFSDGLLMGILLEFVPSQLTEALMSRLPDPQINQDAYKETKQMIIQLVEHKTELAKPAPMDVGNFEPQDAPEYPDNVENWEEELCSFAHKGGGKDGKGKGKGKGACWTCGDMGHRAAECPQNPSGWQKGGWPYGGKGDGKSSWQKGGFPYGGKGDGYSGWQKGGWSNGGNDKGGKGWSQKGWAPKGGGKDSNGKWGRPMNPWYPKGNGKGSPWQDWQGKGQTYGLEEVPAAPENWQLSICTLEESRPTQMFDLDSFIKHKKAVKVKNSFAALEELNEMKDDAADTIENEEITLEDGVKAIVLRPVPKAKWEKPRKAGKRRPKVEFCPSVCACCHLDNDKSGQKAIESIPTIIPENRTKGNLVDTSGSMDPGGDLGYGRKKAPQSRHLFHHFY